MMAVYVCETDAGGEEGVGWLGRRRGGATAVIRG